MTADVRDDYRRWLCVIGTSVQEPDSGLVPLTRVPDEIEDVRSAFDALGYPRDQHLVLLNRTKAEIDRGLREWLADKGPRDVLALYVTGHAEALGSARPPLLYFHTRGSSQGRTGESLPPSALLDPLGDLPAVERPRNLLVILDACGTGAGLTEAATGLMAWLPPHHEEPDASVGAHVVATARAQDPAHAGVFATAWRAVVEDPAVAPRTTTYLDMGVLLRRVQAWTDAQVLEPLSYGARGPNVCLPNPRHHLAGVDPEQMDQWWDTTARAVARGTPEAARERWLFTGRHMVNRELAGWLGASSPEPPVVVVTAAPGSGKSTVLARLVALSVPDFRAAYAEDLQLQPADELPPESFRFTASIWARRQTTAAVADRVRTALDLAADADLDALSTRPRGPGPVPVIAVDAVDEAESPHRLVLEVLRPLARAAQAGALRLLVATRRFPVDDDPTDPLRQRGDLIAPLTSPGPHQLLDLDGDWFEPGDVTAYANLVLSRSLNDLDRPNPYAQAPTERRRLARAIERRARRSFLLAALVARAHSLDTRLVDPRSVLWEREFPDTIGQAFERELQAAYGPADAAKIRALLRPLAYGHGIGLPRELVADGEDLWAALATALSDEGLPLTTADVDWLLGERVASHLVTGLEAGGGTAYRFHHEALTAYFAPADRRLGRHDAVTTVLLRRLGGPDPADRDWTNASGYTRRALPDHARHAGRIAGLSHDPGLLVTTDPFRLHDALVRDGSPELARLRGQLRGLLHRLPAMSATERATVLALGFLGIPELSERAAALEAYVPAWLRGRAAVGQDHAEPLTIDTYPYWVMNLAADDGETGPLLALGCAWLARLVDPDTGTTLLTLGKPGGGLQARYVAFGRDADGVLFLATGGRDVRLWDPLTGDLLYVSDEHVPTVKQLLAGRAGPDGLPFVASADDGHVRVWDPTDRTERWRGPAVAASLDVLPWPDEFWRLVVATSREVQIVDPATGRPLTALPVMQPRAPLLAVAHRAHSPALLAVGGEHGVWVWDVATGAVDSLPLQGRPTTLTAGTDRSGAPYLATGATDGTVAVWNASDGTLRHAGRAHTGPVEHAVTGRSGDGVPLLVTAAQHGEVSVRDPDDLEHSSGFGTDHIITAIGIGRHRDGALYAASGSAGTAHLWELRNVSGTDTTGGHTGAVHQLAATTAADGRRLLVTVAGDPDARVWDPDTGALRHTLPGASPYAKAPEGLSRSVLTKLAVGQRADGTPTAATFGTDGTVRLWDIGSGHLHRELEFDGSSRVPVQVVAGTDADGALFVAAGASREVRVWQAETGQLLGAFSLPGEAKLIFDRDVTRMAFVTHPSDAPALAVGGQDGSVWLWPVGAGEPTMLEPTHRGFVSAIQSGVGKQRWLATGSREGDLRVWNPVTGQLEHDLSFSEGWVTGITGGLRADRTPFLAAVCNGQPGITLRVWNPDTGGLLHEHTIADYTSDYQLRAGADASGGPILVGVASEWFEVLWLGPPVRCRQAPLPTKSRDALVIGDTVVVGARAGYVTARVHDAP